MPRAYLVVSIDCEHDKGPGWRSQKPLAFEGISRGVGERLEPLFRRHRAKATYLLSAEVVRDARSAELLSKLGGAELGAHLHGEYAEPLAHEPEVTRELQRDYPPEVERAKLASLTSLFSSTFGARPRSFRAGRFGIGPATLEILEALGYAVDSSVTPFVDWTHLSPGLSFLTAPTQPYHPDRRAPERTGSSPVLEVPVTIRPHALARLPLFGKFAPARWLRPTWGSSDALVRIAKEEIAAGGPPVVLNAMLHNVEVVPRASPYAQTEPEARAILDRLSSLLAYAEREGIPVVGLGDVPELVSGKA